MKTKVYLIIALLLFLAVPWLFFDYSETQVLGFPIWAFYSVCFTVLFAVVVSVFIQRYWEKFSGEEDNE